MAYIDTPRTDAGNATFAADGIGDISLERSFLGSRRQPRDIVSQMRAQRGQSFRTPSARTALTSRPNPTGARRSGEFTPLLQSVTKRNVFQGKENASTNDIKTPAFLKSGYIPKESPALSTLLGSSAYGSEPSFLENHPADLPQIASSSAQSTPVAQLPKASQGVLEDRRNLMSLREQENIISKIEKENFGLKLKIHYMEERLRNHDPHLNENALKENIDLKVDKAQLQKDLGKVRKAMSQSEKLAESLRQQMRDGQQQAQKTEFEQDLRNEAAALRKALDDKQGELDDLKEQLANDSRDQELRKLHDDIDDLELELREQQRSIDTKDDEIEMLNDKISKADDLVMQVEELKEGNHRIEELEKAIQTMKDEIQQKDDQLEDAQEAMVDLKDEFAQAQLKTKEAFEACEEAKRAKQSAVDDLEELQAEMADKSFTTKGLSRQLDEKMRKQEVENQDLKESIHELRDQLQQAAHDTKKHKEALEVEQQNHDFDQRQLQEELKSLKQIHDLNLKSWSNSDHEAEELRRTIQTVTNDKDLLKTRNNALTAEAHSLQRDLTNYHKDLSALQQELEDEKQMSLNNEHHLRAEAKQYSEQLSKQIDVLQRKLDTEIGNMSNQKDLWTSERRDLQLGKDQAEQRAAGLQRAVDRLQASQGSLSDKEKQLQQAIENEQQRHKDEQSLLSRQIDDLREDLEQRRKSLEESRADILRLKEEYRLSSRDKETFQDKIQALEDEIEVLQASLEDDSERAKADTHLARQEVENLRKQVSSSKQEITRLEYELSSARLEIDSYQGDLKAGKGSEVQLGTKIRELESQMTQLRNDKHQLQEEITRLQSEKASARAEIGTFRMDLQAGRGSNEQLRSRNRELEAQLTRIRNEKSDLDDRLATAIADIENLQDAAELIDGSNNSNLRRDLASSRAKEIELSKRETRLKDEVRSLKKEVSKLETRMHEAELAKISISSSPGPAKLSSARSNEISELRRQLNNAESQAFDLKHQLKDKEHSSKAQIDKVTADLLEHQTDADVLKRRLEMKISDLEAKLSQQQALSNSNTQTISRLRVRIMNLEKELKESRTSTITESEMASERADLHGMLQKSKLEAEDMAQLAQEQAEQLDIKVIREKQLTSQLKLVRQECVMRQQKTGKLEKELVSLQGRYQNLVQEMATANEMYYDQQNDLKRHVHFVDTTITNLERDLRTEHSEVLKKNHEEELAEVKTQLEWMKAKLKRESSHKKALVYEKQYLEKEIETFEACNRINLNMLRRIIPKRSSQDTEDEPVQRTIRHVGLAIVSAIRMRNLARKWASTREHLEPRPITQDSVAKAAATIPKQQKSHSVKKASNVQITKSTSIEQPPKIQQSLVAESSSTPRLAELKRSLATESQAASDLLRKHSSSKTFEIADAEKFVSAMAKTIKSFQNTDVGVNISRNSAEVTNTLSTASGMILEKTGTVTNISQTPQEDLDTAQTDTESLQDEIENESSSRKESAASDYRLDVSTQEDACVTLDSGTFDIFAWAGKQRKLSDSQKTAHLFRRKEDGGRGRVEIDYEHYSNPVTIESDIADWDLQPALHKVRDATSTRFRSEGTHGKSSSSKRQSNGPASRNPTSAVFDDIGAQKRKEQSVSLAATMHKTDSGTENILTMQSHRDARRNTSQNFDSAHLQDQQSNVRRDNRKKSSTDAVTMMQHRNQDIPHGTVLDRDRLEPSDDLSSVSGISTAEELEQENHVKQYRLHTSNERAKSEWWASIKADSEKPFEGQVKIKWKGYIATKDPGFTLKSTPEKSRAIKKAIEKLAIDRTMQHAKSEARQYAKDGALGKRKFEGKTG